MAGRIKQCLVTKKSKIFGKTDQKNQNFSNASVMSIDVHTEIILCVQRIVKNQGSKIDAYR